MKMSKCFYASYYSSIFSIFFFYTFLYSIPSTVSCVQDAHTTISSSMDATTASIVEKYQESQLKNVNGLSDSDDDNLLEILEGLDDEDDVMHQLREQRLEQLKKEFRSIDRATDTLGSDAGKVQFFSDEKELMNLVTRTEMAVVHFFQPSFPKCKAMNDALNQVAEKHLSLSVLAIQADKAPFLVAKLKVKVLPFVVVYTKGRELTRLVGFDGIATGNDVNVELLERKLLECGAINRRTTNYKTIRGKKPIEESDDDWE